MDKFLIFLLATTALVHSTTEAAHAHSLDELLREVARRYGDSEGIDERNFPEADIGSDLNIEARFEPEDDVMEETIPVEIEEEEEIPSDALDRELEDILQGRIVNNFSIIEMKGIAEPFTTWAVDPDIWGSDLKMGHTRPGSASDDDDCHRITSVPSELKSSSFYKPVSNFYKKYTHAYEIPILGSNDVTDEGLKRACYVIKFMLADRYDMRNVFYKFWGRIALIGDNEQQTDLPDYSHLDSAYWDARARGLGATRGVPTCSAGDDNMRCADGDRYWNQDILVHEFAHGVHTMAAQHVIPGFAASLMDAYNSAKATGKWEGTYAATNFREYWAMANQMYLNSYNGNEYEVTVNGETKYMRDRETLAQYDPTVKELIDRLYPCQNTFIHRCQWKKCTLGNYEAVVENANKRSGCSVIKTSYSVDTLEQCAEYTCSKSGNAFNYRRTYCYALDCSNGDIELEDHSSQHHVYRLTHPPQLNLQAEESTPMEFNCAPKQEVGLSGDDRCSDPSTEVCGDSESKGSCRQKGCCWKNRTCYFPQQDCRDEALNCPGKATSGKCSDSSIRNKCPLSCGDYQCR